MNQVTAFTQLLRIRGENVTFRGVAGVRALVNRVGNQFNKNSRMPTEAKVPSGAIIQFPISVEEPPVGEVITDSRGKVHSIQIVTDLGHCWECQCGIS
jgi:hypothetical protein